MARTVVGLFKNADEAQSVKHDLVNRGYSAESIRVLGNDGQTEAWGPFSGSIEPASSGFAATISNFFRSFTGSNSDDEKQYAEGVRTGGALLAVTVTEDQADAVADLLGQHGATNVDEQSASAVNAQGKAQPRAGTELSESGQTLNVVEEELQVGKRQVQRGGIRVYSHVTERPVEENITLREEHVLVERRPVNRAATDADFEAFKEGSIELIETGEEAVVSKTSRVVEEVTVGKDVSERQHTVKDTVRRTDVEVENIIPERSSKTSEYNS